MICATLDSNVIVSGLNFTGKPRRILELGEIGAIRLAISDAILQEVSNVLQRRKFGWSRDEAVKAIEGLSAIANRVEPKESVSVIKNNPTDNRILECVAADNSDYLVTGDNHLLALRQSRLPISFLLFRAKT